MDNKVLEVAKEQLITRSRHNMQNAVLCTNTESVKIFLVLPFLQFLGYDITDPKELFPEYVSSVSTVSADLVLIKENSPIMVINVTKIGEVNEQARTRLKEVFKNSKSNIAILTDGITYEVYTDLSKLGYLDSKPYISFSMKKIVDEQAELPTQTVEDIAFLSKAFFNPNEVFSRAMMYAVRETSQEVANKFIEHDDFIRIIVEKVAKLKDFDSTRISQDIIHANKPIILAKIRELYGQRKSELIQQRHETIEVKNQPVATNNKPTNEIYAAESDIYQFVTSEIRVFLEKQKTSDNYLKLVSSEKTDDIYQIFYKNKENGTFIKVKTAPEDKVEIIFYGVNDALISEHDSLIKNLNNESTKATILKSFTAVVNSING